MLFVASRQRYRRPDPLNDPVHLLFGYQGASKANLEEIVGVDFLVLRILQLRLPSFLELHLFAHYGDLVFKRQTVLGAFGNVLPRLVVASDSLEEISYRHGEQLARHG